jgi:hypothetical protein
LKDQVPGSAPIQESDNGPAVAPFGMGIVNAGKKLVMGKAGIAAGVENKGMRFGPLDEARFLDCQRETFIAHF